jgi:hypothetical protein
VLDGEKILPVVRQALVKRAVLLFVNICWVTRPYGLGLIELFVGGLLLLNLLRLLLFGFIFLILDVFNLGLVLTLLCLLNLSLSLSLIIFDFLWQR